MRAKLWPWSIEYAQIHGRYAINIHTGTSKCRRDSVLVILHGMLPRIDPVRMLARNCDFVDSSRSQPHLVHFTEP